MTTLPKPHHLGVPIGEFDLGENAAVEKEGEERRSSFGAGDVAKEYPDVVAVGVDTEQNRVHVLDVQTVVLQYTITCSFSRGHNLPGGLSHSCSVCVCVYHIHIRMCVRTYVPSRVSAYLTAAVLCVQ